MKVRMEDYFDMPNPKLSSYFGRVRSGASETITTPFFKYGGGQNKILTSWGRILMKEIKHMPGLIAFENDLKAKVGPMSVMRPLSERMPDLESYYDSILLESKPLDNTALDAVVDEWGASSGFIARPMSQDDTVAHMKKSTNSGNPFFRKKRDVVNATIPCYITKGKRGYTMHSPGGVYEALAILGWRGQEGGPTAEDVKQRVVWMMPFALNICELQIYTPLIEYAQDKGIVPAWIGNLAVDRSITQLMDTKGRNDLIVCTDFTKFDQHFNRMCQDGAEYILKALMPGDATMRSWFNNVFRAKYEIPLLYSVGDAMTGNHGMGSGSGGTNFDETLLHRALQYEAAFANGAKLNPHSMCLGDDGILSYPGITVDDVTRSYSAHGLVMNKEKQSASTHECTYLRRWHDYEFRRNDVCVGVYSTFRALGRLMYQERWYDEDAWGPKMVALRQLSILENCCFHPAFESLMRFVMERDKYRIGIDIPGFLENIDKEAEKANTAINEFMGYRQSETKEGQSTPLSSWHTVQYLLKHR